MAVKEKVMTTDFNNREIYIEKVDENYLNFHTNLKKEKYEVNFYIFSEEEINDLIERQRKLYALLEKENDKSALRQKFERVLSLLKTYKQTISNIGIANSEG